MEPAIRPEPVAPLAFVAAQQQPGSGDPMSAQEPAAAPSPDTPEPKSDPPSLSLQPLAADGWRLLVKASDDAHRPAPGAWSKAPAPVEAVETGITPIGISEDTLATSYMAISAGVILWSMRAAGLLVSVLASLPAWSSLDPLPILANPPGDDDDAPSGPGSPSDAIEDDRLDAIFANPDRDS